MARVPGLARAVATGQRIFLRPPTRRDENEFVATMHRSRRHFARWGRPPDEPAKYRKWLADRSEHKLGFLICRRDDGTIMGQVSLGNIVRGLFQNAYTGYYVAQPYEGHGYVMEALRLVLRHAFRDLKLHRVEANIQPENARSKRLARRCGFRKEGYSPRFLKMGGRWRDHERWAITVEDWRADRTRAHGRRPDQTGTNQTP